MGSSTVSILEPEAMAHPALVGLVLVGIDMDWASTNDQEQEWGCRSPVIGHCPGGLCIGDGWHWLLREIREPCPLE